MSCAERIVSVPDPPSGEGGSGNETTGHTSARTESATSVRVPQTVSGQPA